MPTRRPFLSRWRQSIGVELKEPTCKEDEATTAGGPTTVWSYPHGLHIEIEGIDHWVKAEFCEKLDVPLLGRKDFFMNYRVTFDERRHVFVLDAYMGSAVDALLAAPAGKRS